MTAWFERFSDWFERLLTTLDQALCVWLRGWAYVWLNRGDLPSADQTISAYVGLRALAGKKWALVAQKVINAIMLNPDHCREAIASDGKD